MRHMRTFHFKYLIITMETNVNCDDQYGKMDWDSKTIVAASGLLMYCSFTSLVSFISTMNAMALISNKATEAK